MDTEHLKTLVLVAKYKNFTKVSDLIGKTPGGVRHQMDTLERHLKVKLYHGFPSGIQLTEEGIEFAKEAEEIYGRLESKITNLRAAKASEEGRLNLIVANFGMNWFAPFVQEFCERYPDIKLKISLDDYRSLFYASALSGVFVGLITFDPPPDTPFIWQKMGEFHWYPFAHPKYLKKHGSPQTLNDLSGHHLIRYEWAPEHTRLGDLKSNVLLYAGLQGEEIKKREEFISTDDTLCCKKLIEEGVGIGLIPRFLAYQSELVELLKGIYPKELGLKQAL